MFYLYTVQTFSQNIIQYYYQKLHMQIRKIFVISVTYICIIYTDTLM